MNNAELAKAILKEVGGEENIRHYTNCVTRLRFQLKDEKKVNQAALERMNGVLGTQFQGGQFQVILGGKVVHVANEFNQLVSLDHHSEGEDANKGGVVTHALNALSAILTPALPPVIAGGILKGFIFMFMNFGWASATGDSIIFFNGLSDAMFYFFPFLLAVSSARYFKTNEYMALTLAGLMMYPLAIADGQQMLRLFGFLPIAVVDYSSSVLPIVFSVWLLKHIKQFFDRYIPDMVSMVFSPLLSLVITAPIAMSLLAPLGFYVGEYVAEGVKALIDFSPWLAGLVVGGTRPLLVLAGMHHAMNPIMQQEVTSFGYSQMVAMILMSTLAQATAPLIVYLKVKNKAEKQIALSAVIPGYIGVTEPSIYGVLVKYKGAMIASCLGGGIGAAVATMFGGRSFGFVMPGLISLPAFMGEGFSGIVIGMMVTVLVTAILTFVLMDRFKNKEASAKIKTEEVGHDDQREPLPDSAHMLSVASPVKGEFISLETIGDATFAKEVLGVTTAVTSSDGKIYAPFDGEVKAVFPTKHAIGLKSLEGDIELLIHVGLDTVMLDGEGFTLHVEQGDKIAKGALLMTFDKRVIAAHHLSDTVITVVTNSEQFNSVTVVPKLGTIDLNQNLFHIIN